MGTKTGGNAASRKKGRNKKWCERYRLVHQQEYNQCKRLIGHLRRLPNDAEAKTALRRAKAVLDVGRTREIQRFQDERGVVV